MILKEIESSKAKKTITRRRALALGATGTVGLFAFGRWVPRFIGSVPKMIPLDGSMSLSELKGRIESAKPGDRLEWQESVDLGTEYLDLDLPNGTPSAPILMAPKPAELITVKSTRPHPRTLNTRDMATRLERTLTLSGGSYFQIRRFTVDGGICWQAKALDHHTNITGSGTSPNDQIPGILDGDQTSHRKYLRDTKGWKDAVLKPWVRWMTFVGRGLYASGFWDASLENNTYRDLLPTEGGGFNLNRSLGCVIKTQHILGIPGPMSGEGHDYNESGRLGSYSGWNTVEDCDAINLMGIARGFTEDAMTFHNVVQRCRVQGGHRNGPQHAMVGSAYLDNVFTGASDAGLTIGRDDFDDFGGDPVHWVKQATFLRNDLRGNKHSLRLSATQDCLFDGNILDPGASIVSKNLPTRYLTENNTWNGSLGIPEELFN